MKLHTCKAGSAGWLSEFYEIARYAGEVVEGDDVYFAECDGLKLGVVRIAKEHNISVLRGMQVLAPYQGKGIGQKLLEYIEPALGPEPVYCIPWDHLAKFYNSIGFRVIETAEAPEFLAKRLEGYLHRGRKVLLMKRDHAS